MVEISETTRQILLAMVERAQAKKEAEKLAQQNLQSDLQEQGLDADSQSTSTAQERSDLRDE